MNLIIVSGPEATCKTYIGREIAKSLNYNYLGKDVIKESMFDQKDHSTWDYRWYETKAKEEFFKQLENYVSNNINIVVESNFIGADKKSLQKCLTQNVSVAEIYCYAKGMTTLKRFIKRNESGNRHKGHHDRLWYPKILLENLLQYGNIRWPSKPSGLAHVLVEVDTTHFQNINIQFVLKSMHII